MIANPCVDLVRHGAVDGPAALYGRTDVPMSAEGWRGFDPLLTLAHSPYALVVTSPLRRCAAVADKIADHHGLPVQIVPELREMDFGDWDGVAFADLEDQWPAMGRFRDDPQSHSPPNGETLADLCQRVRAGWDKVCILAEKHGPVLVLSHGGPTRLVVADILGTVADGRLFRRLTIPCASRTRVRLTPAEAVLEHVVHLL